MSKKYDVISKFINQCRTHYLKWDLTHDISDEMNKILQNFAQNPKLQAEMRAKSAEISEYYSEDRLLKIWIDFYREQAKNK